MNRASPGLRLTGTVNRGMVVALGRFGARALAHLWSRLRFEDYQRSILSPGLPSLEHTVGYSLVLPNASGGFVVGAPDPEHWDLGLIQRLSLPPAPPAMTADEIHQLYNEVLPASLHHVQSVAGTGGAGREAAFRTALEGAAALSAHFTCVADEVRIDQRAPGREAGRFTAYVVAALHDEGASALLWPVVMALRDRLQLHLALEVVGLLSTGVYDAEAERQRQGAAVHAALCELACFASPPDDALSLPPPWDSRLGQPFLDRCYLLDSEKRNLTRPRGEDEVIVAIGNALETMLLSEAPDRIAAFFGPDDDVLHALGPFGTLGAASVYVPIDEWNNRNRQQYMLEMLREHFLSPTVPDDLSRRLPEEVRALSDRVASLGHLVAELTRRLPFSLLKETGDRQPRGEIGLLLRDTGQNQPLTGEGPSLPLPVVQIDPDAIRVDFVEADPNTGTRRALDPEEWLGHLYRHYRRLGLDEEHLFPGDPDLPAMQAGWRAPARTQLDEWSDAMRLNADTRQADSLVPPSDVPPLSLDPRQASGIVPETDRLLRAHALQHLLRDNHGLKTATALMDQLSQALKSSLRQVNDYRLRLARALDSDPQTPARAAQRRLGFRRALADRPRLPGLISRGVLLTAWIAVLTFYTAPLLNPAVDPARLPALSVIGAAAISGLAGVAIFRRHHTRVRRLIRLIERDLARALSLQVNHMLGQHLLCRASSLPAAAGDAKKDSPPGPDGLLPDLDGLITAFQNALKAARKELERRATELETALSEPLARQPAFLRQPLPGLEELERRLQDEARASGDASLHPRLVASTPQAADALEPLLANDVARLTDRPEPFAAPRQYQSLGDVIFNAVEVRAGKIRSIVPPAGLKVETLLQSNLPDYRPRSFLIELRGRTQPMLGWDDEALPRGFPIEMEILALEEPASSPALAALSAALKMQSVGSLDPFSITCLRVVHGLRAEAVPHFAVYAADWRYIGPTERAGIALSPAALAETGEYLRPKSVPTASFDREGSHA